MQAGKLRHRVTIQQYTVTRDGFGAEVKTWVDLATVWAAIEPAGAGTNEQFRSQADQLVATRMTLIRIRQRDGLDNAKLRVVHGSRIFDVQSVEFEPTLRRQMILICQEINV